MKFKKIYPKVVVTVIVFFAVVTIGTFINISKSNLNDAIIDATLSEMKQVGAQLEYRLEETLEEAEADLTLLADHIEENDISSEKIWSSLAEQSQAEEFNELYYITLEGEGVSTSGATQDFKANESFLSALKNVEFVSRPNVDYEMDKISFEIAVPIIEEGEVISVLWGEITLEDFFESIEAAVGETGDVFIIDNNLKLIFSTSANQIGMEAIPENDLSEMGSKNIKIAQEAVLADENGGFYYDYYGTPKVMVYYPIENTNWAFAINVEAKAVSKILVDAVELSNTLGGAIYWIVIILVIYISIAQIRSNKAMLKVAYYDPLTELPNMAKLKLVMKEELSNNKNKPYTIVVFDIENFKAINEMFGHKIGDNVLKAIKPFSESLHEPSLITARISGDKFVMFSGKGLLDNLSVLTDNVDSHFGTHVPEVANYSATYKVGRYRIEEGETDIDDIIAKVNLAHLRAKASKSEAICDYDDEFKKKVLVEADVISKMKSALENEEFKVYLQPKFSTYDDRLVGAEALVRWIEGDGNIMYPNDFIPLFERNGFIVDLDRYMLEAVCKLIRRWMDEGLGEVRISVNCSRLNLENPFFVDGVVAIADKHNVPHECIEIELTESATIVNEGTIEQLFRDLRENGFKISIDDFGAGYSSLGMLKNLNVDTLKMDRSFFANSKNELRDDLLIDSIVKMSHNLGMLVVAEGIETLEQVELLKTMNCDAIQGYVHAKPMPISEFEDKHKSSMLEDSDSRYRNTSIIRNINNIKFANTFAPCGLLIVNMDENFTIVEANDYYFKMIGYTREEVRDIFQNEGLRMMDSESQLEANRILEEQMKNDPEGNMELINRFNIKSGEEHTFKLNGRIALSENGEKRFYFSIMDITDYVKMDSKLREERKKYQK